MPGLPCDDGNTCTQPDKCEQGECHPGKPVACDDHQDCTADWCNPAVGCVHDTLTGTACDDHDACTTDDTCSAGECTGTILTCDDTNPCTDDLCDPLAGCVFVPVAIPCNDGDPCTAGDYCEAGTCHMEPKAGILFFTLGGNDYLRACQSGLGRMGGIEWFLTMTAIQRDLQSFVALAQAGRPDLKVVLIGYDYLNYLMIQALGHEFPGFDWIKFNLGMVDLASRQRTVAASASNMVYAHNMGLLQHTFGDPMFGYGPGAAPKPGPAPEYLPFPGGWFTYPSPVAHIPDGIHPDDAGYRAIIENTLDQGAAAWIEGRPWP